MAAQGIELRDWFRGPDQWPDGLEEVFAYVPPEERERSQQRTANIAFVASEYGKSPRDVAKVWDTIRPGLASAYFGLEGDPGDAGFYQEAGRRFDKIDAEKAMFADATKSPAAYAMETGMSLGGNWWEAYEQFKGEGVPEGWNPQNEPEYVRIFQEQFERAVENYEPIRAIADEIVTSLEKERAGKGDPKQREKLLESLAGLGDEQLEALPTIIARLVKEGGKAKPAEGKDKPEAKAKKGYFYSLAEEIGRGGKDLRPFDSTPAMHSELRALDAGEIRMSIDADSNLSPEELWNWRGIKGVRGAGTERAGVERTDKGRELTKEEKENYREFLENAVRKDKIATALRRVGDTIIDPAAEPRGWLARGIAGIGPGQEFRGSYPTMRQIPFSATGLIPYAGLPLIYLSERRFRYEEALDNGLTPEQADRLATTVTPFTAPIEWLQSKLLIGRTPFTKALTNVRNTWLRRIGIGATAVAEQAVLQNAQEALQDFIPIVAQEFSREMPGVDWDARLSQYRQERVETFWALLPLVVIGSAGTTAREMGNFRTIDVQADHLQALNIPPEAARDIAAEMATNPKAAAGKLTGAYRAAQVERERQVAEGVIPPDGVTANQRQALDRLETELDASEKSFEAIAQAQFPGVTLRKRGEGDYVVGLPGESAVQVDSLDAARVVMEGFGQTRATMQVSALRDLVTKYQSMRVPGQTFEVMLEQEATATDMLKQWESEGRGDLVAALKERIGILERERGEAYDPGKVAVLGMNEGRLRGAIFEDVSRIRKGATILSVVEERSEGMFKRWKELGRYSKETYTGWVREYEKALGRVLLSEAPSDLEITEALSTIAVEFFTARGAEAGIVPELRRLLQQLLHYIEAVLVRGMSLSQAFKEGKLSGEFEAALAESVGIDAASVAAMETARAAEAEKAELQGEVAKETAEAPPAAKETQADLADKQRRFREAIGRPTKTRRDLVKVSELEAGDSITVGGEVLTVHSVEDQLDGTSVVHLTGGEKYGDQDIPADEAEIWVEKLEKGGEVSFAIGRATVTPNPQTQAFIGKGDSPTVIGPATFAIQAFHGTPHEVDRFSSERIGTGEGAQVYGWGLYFSATRAVAEHYRKTLFNKQFIDKTRNEYDRDIEPADALEALLESDAFSAGEKRLIRALEKDDFLGFDYPHQAVTEALLHPQNWDLSEETQAALRELGSVYTVRLNVQEDRLLEWDKRLSEQSPYVRERIEKILPDRDTAKRLHEENVKRGLSEFKGDNKRKYTLAYFSARRDPDNTGGNFYEFLSLSEAGEPGTERERGDSKKASEELLALGIQGIRYKDGMSRGKEEGTYNYVIFDDSLIEITGEETREAAQPSFSIAVPKPGKDGSYGPHDWTGDEWVFEGSKPQSNGFLGVISDDRIKGKWYANVTVVDHTEIGYTPLNDRFRYFPNVRGGVVFWQFADEVSPETLSYVEEWIAKQGLPLTNIQTNTFPSFSIAPSAYYNTLYASLDARGQGNEMRAAVFQVARRRLVAMRNDTDWNTAPVVQKVRRAIRELQAILSALPADARNVMSFLDADGNRQRFSAAYLTNKMASYSTDAGRLRFLQSEALPRFSGAIEAWLRRYYLERVEDLFKQGTPKKKENRNVSGGMVGDAERLVRTAQQYADMPAEEVEARVNGLEAAIAQASDPDLLMNLAEELEIAEMFGDLEHQDSATLEQAEAWLERVITQGRTAYRVIEEARREANRALAAQGVAELGRTDPTARDQRSRDLADAPSTASSVTRFMWDLLSFDNILDLMGLGEVRSQIRKAFRTATNQYTDTLLRRRLEFENAMEGILGTRNALRTWQRISELSEQVETPIEFLVGRIVERPPPMPIEQARRVVAGEITVEPEVLAGVETALLEFDALPAAMQGRRSVLRYEVMRNPGVRVKQRMAPLDALYYLQLYRQAGYAEALDRHGIDEQAMQQLQGWLAQEHPEVLQIGGWLGAQYDAGHAPLNTLHQRLYGALLPKVDLYAPGRFERMNAKNGLDLMDLQVPVGTTAAGFKKSRITHRAAPKKSNALAVYWAHVMQTEYWLAFAEPTRNARAVLGNEDLWNAMRAEVGTQKAAKVAAWLEVMESGGVNRALRHMEMDAVLSKVASGTAFLGLAYNLSTMFKQASAMIGTAVRVPAPAFLRGLAEIAVNPARYVELFRSPTIQRRIQSGYSPEMRMAMNAMEATPSTILWFLQKGTHSIGVVDAAFTTVSAAIAYDYHHRQALDAGMSEDAARERALEAMDDAVTATAQPAEPMDRSLQENNAGAAMRLLFMFRSEMRQKIAIAYVALANVQRGRNVAQNAQAALVVLLVMPAITATMTALFALLVKGDEPEEAFDPKKFLAGILRSQAGGVFLFGDIYEGLVNRILKQPTFPQETVRAVSGAQKIYTGLIKGTYWDDLSGAFVSGDVKEIIFEVNKVTQAFSQLASTVRKELALPGVVTRMARDAYGLAENTTSAVYDMIHPEVKQARQAGEEIMEEQKEASEARLAERDKIAALPEKERNARLRKLRSGSTEQKRMAQSVADKLERDALTKDEKEIAKYAVTGGYRARFLKLKLDRMKERERAPYLKRLKEVGLLSKTVQKQLDALK